MVPEEEEEKIKTEIITDLPSEEEKIKTEILTDLPNPQAEKQITEKPKMGNTKRRIIAYGIIFLVLILGWHIIETHSMQKDNSDLSINPLTNLVVVEFDTEGSNLVYLGGMLGGQLLEGVMNVRAREHYDMYAILIPYRVKIKNNYQPSYLNDDNTYKVKTENSDKPSNTNEQETDKTKDPGYLERKRKYDAEREEYLRNKRNKTE